MAKKILKAKYGVELQEDEKGKLYMTLDGYHVFPSGLPKELRKMVDKSYDNIISIREKDGYE